MPPLSDKHRAERLGPAQTSARVGAERVGSENSLSRVDVGQDEAITEPPPNVSDAPRRGHLRVPRRPFSGKSSPPGGRAGRAAASSATRRPERRGNRRRPCRRRFAEASQNRRGRRRADARISSAAPSAPRRAISPRRSRGEIKRPDGRRRPHGSLPHDTKRRWGLPIASRHVHAT